MEFSRPETEPEVDESGISTTGNLKPSEVKKDPRSIPLSKDGRKIAESHSPKPKSGGQRVKLFRLRRDDKLDRFSFRRVWYIQARPEPNRDEHINIVPF